MSEHKHPNDCASQAKEHDTGLPRAGRGGHRKDRDTERASRDRAYDNDMERGGLEEQVKLGTSPEKPDGNGRGGK
jgi:hypothetical protein